ncbi:hypothetical protein [Spirosoma harenae]
MRDPYFLTRFRFYLHLFKFTRYGLSLLLIGLLRACHLGQPTNLEQVQVANLRLTKIRHSHLNHHDWKAAERLCAKTSENLIPLLGHF